MLENRVRILENEQEKDQRIIKKLQEEISSRKRSINEIGDCANDELEVPRMKMRKCRHLEEPIVLELRGEEICFRAGQGGTKSFSLRLVSDVNSDAAV